MKGPSVETVETGLAIATGVVVGAVVYEGAKFARVAFQEHQAEGHKEEVPTYDIFDGNQDSGDGGFDMVESLEIATEPPVAIPPYILL